MDGSPQELSSDRTITATSSEIKIPDGTVWTLQQLPLEIVIQLQLKVVPLVVDSMSTGWTDEKHSLYLNSIEASFVSQLYSSELRSRDLLGWLPRKQNQTSSSGSSANSLMSGQFKVQRLGCWENLRFERAKRQVDIENRSRLVSENPWIRHFRSPSIRKETHVTDSEKGKEPHIVASDQVDGNELASQSIHLARRSRGREPTSSKQLPAYFSLLYRQDSVGSNTEVSDQNFVDKEIERGKQPSKKRVRNVAADLPMKDQVVPSGKSLVETDADETHACLKVKDAECSSRKPEGRAGFTYLEPDPSFFKDDDDDHDQLSNGVNAE